MTMAMPIEKLLSKRVHVARSAKDMLKGNFSACTCKTAYVAKKLANITVSVKR